MMSANLDLVVQATQAGPRPSSVVQAMLVGILIIFFLSFLVVGFTAKRINNIHDPTYSKAFGATLLKNLVGWAAFALFAFYFEAPLLVTLAVVMLVVPVLIYRFVFACGWPEATLLWVAAIVVEVGAGYALTRFGIMTLSGVTGG